MMPSTLPEQSLTVMMNQYQAGIVSYLNVVVAQTLALNNEKTAVDIRGRRLNACVLLVKGLGGGWKGFQEASLKSSAGRAATVIAS